MPLKAAHRSIQACRRAGVQVVAGGSGFGPGGRHARTLGATTWAGDATSVTVTAALGPWSDEPPAADGVVCSPDNEHAVIETHRSAIVGSAVDVLAGRVSTARGDSLSEALSFLAAAAEAALFVDDASLVASCLPATGRLLSQGTVAVAGAAERH